MLASTSRCCVAAHVAVRVWVCLRSWVHSWVSSSPPGASWLLGQGKRSCAGLQDLYQQLCVCSLLGCDFLKPQTQLVVHI